MVLTTPSTPSKETEEQTLNQDELRPVLEKARRVDTMRAVGATLVGAVVIFGFSLIDLDNWPLGLYHPITDRIPWAVGLAAVVVALLGGLIYVQKWRNPERGVSPLMGLDATRRREAETAIKEARASTDPLLRHLEVMRAQQFAAIGTNALPGALLSAGIYALVAIVMFFSGSPGFGIFWALMSCYSGISTYHTRRSAQAAQRFLAQLDEPVGGCGNTAASR